MKNIDAVDSNTDAMVVFAVTIEGLALIANTRELFVSRYIIIKSHTILKILKFQVAMNFQKYPIGFH